MHKVVKATVVAPGRLRLEFEDGVKGEVDLSGLTGNGVFECWNQPGVFEAVKIGDRGELIWSEVADLCPDSLYLKVTGKQPEDLFPALRRLTVNA